jgi:rubrerythrin
MEQNNICPHCQIVNVDEDHMSSCPTLKVPAAISENEPQLGPPEKIKRIAEFTKKYAVSTVEEKEQLWVCRACYHFGEISDTPPVVCLYCGIAFIVPAREFMEKLGR